MTAARAFGRTLGVTPFAAKTTRLVVDLNRLPTNRNVFSAYTRSLPAEQRAAALDTHYWPYRKAVEGSVVQALEGGEAVLHISTHSFTPVLRGEVRNCDIGFLYDPRERGEVRVVEAWYAALAAHPETRKYRINVESEQGVIRLEGTAALEKATEVARGVAGVEDVKSQLLEVPPIPPFVA